MMKNIINTINKYKQYNFKILTLLKLFNLSKRRYYYFKHIIKTKENFKNIKKQNIKKNINSITNEEKEKVIKYALSHTQYFHRELTYRMIDENVAFLSPISVYRILKQANLIKNNKKSYKYEWQHKYSNQASSPDELWQTDITYLKYKNKNVYQLSFIDVYSRFIVFSVTLLNMEANTISSVVNNFLKKNLKKLKRKPIIQSDNGSAYISTEFRNMIGKYNIIHNTIHPATPTENAIIERWHKTFKENLYENTPGKNYEDMLDKIQKTCYIYNYKRYHSSLGYVTPFVYYRGNPEEIYKKRKEKLQIAKQKRIENNKSLYVK